MKCFLLFIALIIIWACSPADKPASVVVVAPVDTSKVIISQEISHANDIAKYMRNRIDFDSLLNALIPQQKVKIIDSLVDSRPVEVMATEDQNDVIEWIHTYKGKLYTFKIKVENTDPFNSILVDGKHEVNFKKHKITFPEGNERNEYGFNNENMLYNARVIEVCGKKFLYSELSHRCNGTGCGVNLTMIYDLQYHKATFLSNYRIYSDRFYLSDFNNDSVPDLLVFNQRWNTPMRAFDYVEESELELCVYQYDKGNFVPYIDQRYNRPYKITLIGISESDRYISYNEYNWSLYSDEWFRKDE